MKQVRQSQSERSNRHESASCRSRSRWGNSFAEPHPRHVVFCEVVALAVGVAMPVFMRHRAAV